MSEKEILFFIVVDSFTANLAFITNSELAVWVALKLSGLLKYKIIGAAFLGVLFANIGNYCLGMIIGNIFINKIVNNPKATNNIGILKILYNNFGIYLLAIGFIPVYSKLVVVLAGFCRYKIYRVILIVTLVKAAYFYYA